jgi:polysaccharide pyruvyl transferase WcaK-like protein
MKPLPSSRVRLSWSRWPRAQAEPAQLKKPIAVLGVFGAGNFGNEATLAAYFRGVRRVDNQQNFTCICYNTDWVESTYGVKAEAIGAGTSGPGAGVRKYWKALLNSEFVRWLRTLRKMRNCGSLVIPGTGVLDDYGTSPRGLPLHLLRWTFAARLSGRPVSFIGIGAGPIVNPLSRRFMAWAAMLATRRSYRDAASKTFAQSIGVDTRYDPVMPDLCFLYADPVPPESAASAVVHVGLGVMTYLGWSSKETSGGDLFDAYIDKLVLFAEWLLARGTNIHLLIGEESDRRAVERLTLRLRNKLPDTANARVSAPNLNSMDDYLRVMDSVDVVVASRFHNLVGAFCKGRPAISIGYSPKNNSLMTDFELEEFTQAIETLDVETLKQQFQLLMSRRIELSTAISSRALSYREIVQHHLSPPLDS